MRYAPTSRGADAQVADGFPRFRVRAPRPIPASTSRTTDAGMRTGPPVQNVVNKAPRVDNQQDQVL